MGHPGLILLDIPCYSVGCTFHAKQLEGDFVECGVNRCIQAMSGMTYINFKSLKNRKYYLFDTFCGLDKELSSEVEYLRYINAYPDCYEFVVDSFKELHISVTSGHCFR